MKRVLIIRDDNIGDAVLFSGALRGLRSLWPDAVIHLRVKPHVANLLELCPHVDRVLTTDVLFPWEWMRRHSVPGSWKIEALLKEDYVSRFWYPEYDLVICPVSAPSEPILAAVRHLKASGKWGFGGYMFRTKRFEDSRNIPEQVFDRVYPCVESDEWNHEFGRLAAFLRMCGVTPSEIVPRLWLSEGDERYAGEAMPEGAVLGVFPGADSPWRHWPVEKWQEFLRRQTVAKRVVIFGSAKERGMAASICAGVKEVGVSCLNLTGETTLRQLAACIKRCAWMISTESAGLHLAVALHVPAVGLMGGHHFGRFYPWGDGRIHRVAKADMDCFHCNCDCRYQDFRCVRNISVDTVLSEFGVAADHAAAPG